MARQVDGIALGAVFAGSVFAYAGITGRSIPHAIQAIVQGKSPKTAPQDQPITGGAAPVTAPGGGRTIQASTDSQIANDALSYQGKLGWVLGGSMNSGSPDCSGFVNGVVGRDLKMAIPGVAAGAFDGSQHGPNSFVWLVWGGVARISRAEVQAGDILIWTSGIGHIGFAISNTEMVSDLNPQLGVAVTQISDTATGVFFPFRLRAA